MQRCDIPHNVTTFAFISKAPGKHPDKCKPDFQAKFDMGNCTSNSVRSLVGNVTYVKQKLTFPNIKSPVRPSENVLLISEVVDMFTPQSGFTMDPYPVTLRPRIASMRTARSCTVIEKDEVYSSLLSVKSEKKELSTQFKDKITVSSDLNSDLSAQISTLTSRNSNTINTSVTPVVNEYLNPRDYFHAHSESCEHLPSDMDGIIDSPVHRS